MISRMDRLVIGEVAPFFVFGVFLFTSLFFAGGEILRVAEFLGQGVPPATVGRLLLYTLPWFVSLTFPMAMLLAALLGFGRLSNDSEIVALVAGGASFARIVVPVGVFALLVSLAGVWFTSSIVPAAQNARETIIREVRQGIGGGRSANAFDLSFRNDRGVLTTQLHVEGGIDLASGLLRDVSIETWNKGKPSIFTYAERAEYRGEREWVLYNQTVVPLDQAYIGILKGSALESQKTVRLGTPGELASLEKPVREVSSQTLIERIRLYRAGGETSKAREAEVEVAQRLAVPFASLVFALVGAPLAVRPQRAGKGVGFGLAILIIFGYWTALQVVSFIGKAGLLPPMFALFLPNLAGAVAALFLIRRVLR